MVGLVLGGSLPITYLAKRHCGIVPLGDQYRAQDLSRQSPPRPHLCSPSIAAWQPASHSKTTSGSGLSPGEGGGKHFLTHSQVTPFPLPLPGSHPALLSQPASRFTRSVLPPSHPHISRSPFMGQLQVFITPVSLTPATFMCQPVFTGRTWRKNSKGLEWFGDSHFSQNFACPLIWKRNHGHIWWSSG